MGAGVNGNVWGAKSPLLAAEAIGALARLGDGGKVPFNSHPPPTRGRSAKMRVLAPFSPKRYLTVYSYGSSCKRWGYTTNHKPKAEMSHAFKELATKSDVKGAGVGVGAVGGCRTVYSCRGE